VLKHGQTANLPAGRQVSNKKHPTPKNEGCGIYTIINYQIRCKRTLFGIKSIVKHPQKADQKRAKTIKFFLAHLNIRPWRPRKRGFRVSEEPKKAFPGKSAYTYV
jgi:hypothetical protein